MIFTGDLAAPKKIHAQQLSALFDKYPEIFRSKTLICNFEGLINEDSGLNLNQPILFNHPETVQALKNRGKVVATLANNHILDLPLKYDSTVNTFNRVGILFAGAGKSRVDAGKPLVFEENNQKIILFNACWDFLLYNQKNPANGIYVSTLNERELLKNVTLSRNEHPDAAIVLFLHWNFDLETLPFPMHRQLARDLIDAGANLVVGSHSHCVQGGEKYKKGYIVYGLGNFFIPHHEFAQGKIVYPEFSNTELVLEWCDITNTAKCHWFEYRSEGKEHTLTHLGSDDFEASQKLKDYSPFLGMDETQYYAWFKKNRRKKILIPIYRNHENKMTNWCFTVFLKNRARIARFLAQYNFIKWQN